MRSEIAVIDAAGRLVYRGSGVEAPVDVRWWSLTKRLIAVACLRLVEPGRLDLDCPL